MTHLAKGWNREKLGNVCDMIKRGVAPKYTDEGGICVINQKCIRDHRINLELSRRHNLIVKKVNPERYIRQSDVLVNSTGTGTLGRVAQVRSIPDEPTTVDTHVTIVRPKEGLFFPDFFGYMLVKIEDEITSSGEGASGQTELPRKVLEERFDVTFPKSVTEQKRIVSILDEAFAGIDQAIANTEKNLASARELFESYLNNVFTQKGEGWEEKKLIDIVDSTCSLSYGIVQPGKDYEGGLPVVRPTDLKVKVISKEGLKLIKPEIADKYKRTSLVGGELLLCVRGETGAVSIAGKELVGSNVTRGIVPIRFDSTLISQEFGYYLLISKVFQKQIKEHTYGAALMQINIRDLKKITLPFPPLHTQLQLVEQLNKATQKIWHLEFIYRQKLNSLQELKQSILQKAFTGELTADYLHEQVN